MIEYRVVHSARKTMALQVYPDGTVVVRVPMRMPARSIERFVLEHEDWIQKKLDSLQRQEVLPILTEEEIVSLKRSAADVLPDRVAFYAEKLGVSYGRISVRCQMTRWGSCAANGNLSFNCLLMLAPPEVLDSVIVHELCHRIHMDHSPAFYAEVRRVYPEYDRWHGWLKQHGPALMARVPR